MRALLLILALALPIALAVGVAKFALPPSEPKVARKAMPLQKVEPAVARKLPLEIREAQLMAQARLEQLQAMTQEQWDKERVLIEYRKPPRDIKNAVARAQLRVDDLAKMNQEDWERERRRIMKRDGLENVKGQASAGY